VAQVFENQVSGLVGQSRYSRLDVRP
jgi:hypothetical protein